MGKLLIKLSLFKHVFINVFKDVFDYFNHKYLVFLSFWQKIQNTNSFQKTMAQKQVNKKKNRYGNAIPCEYACIYTYQDT